MLASPIVILLMYFVAPLWIAMGFADWLCHRASRIEVVVFAVIPYLEELWRGLRADARRIVPPAAIAG
jgi:hypothetical protein